MLLTGDRRMAMTNAERQAKWKAKLRAQAASGGSLGVALRERLKAVYAEFLRENENADEAFKRASIAFGYKLNDAPDEALLKWLDDSFIYLANAEIRKNVTGE